MSVMSAVRARTDAPDVGPPTVGAAPPVAVDEQEWLQRIRAGDTSVFEQLMRQYYAGLSDFALGYVGTRVGAEEVVQDVFSTLWERRAAWRVRGTLRAYLFGAVRNRALNALRQERADERRSARAAAEPVAPGLGYPCDPDDVARTEARALGLELAIADLPRAQRAAVELRWQHGLSYAEIAAALGVSAKTVENHLARALAALRRALRR
jgi:RNA polymerase sigma-70 factor (ECF subfamily)